MSEADRPAILVLRLSALGDVVHAMPAVVALRCANPGARIGWVVEAPLREMVATVAPVDRVIAVDTRRWRRAPLAASTAAAIRRVRSELREFARGGTSIDFQGLIKSGIFASLSGCRDRFGFGPSAIRERVALAFVNHRVDVDTSRHVIEQNVELAGACGAREDDARMPDFVRWTERADPSLGDVGRNRVVVVPGAGQAPKRWAMERWVELCREIESRLGARALVVWGPGERELASEVAEAGVASLAPATDLAGLAALLRAARLVVAGDTGPLHLADAVGTRVVGLYGATRAWRNGPWGQPGACLIASSMEAIRVSEVVDRIGSALI